MRSFFFRNDGIVLDRSVHSCERTIIPQERRPALGGGQLNGGWMFEKKSEMANFFY